MKKKIIFSILMLAFTSLFTANAAVVDPAGLILHYPFDGNTNNAVAGTFGAATLANNAVLTTGGGGFSGEALDLTATTGGGSDVDHTLLPENFTVGVTNFTVATWIKIGEVQPGWSRIFDFGNGTDNYLFITANCDGHIRLVLKNSANGEQIIDGTSLPLNEWTHIAATVASGSGSDGKDLGKLYVNGVCVGTKTDITNTLDAMGTATANNYIGRSQYGNAGYKGYVDDFRFYTRALSDLEIKILALHEGEALVEAYPFDGSSAETKYFPVTTKFMMDGWANFVLYDDATGFVLNESTKNVTTNWETLPQNDALRMSVHFKRNYDGFSGDPTEVISEELWVAIPWAGDDEKIGLIPSSTIDITTKGDTGNENNILGLLTAHSDATITVTKITLNNFGRSNVVYQLASANVGGADVTAIGLDVCKPYSGEFTATEEGNQAFWINRFAIPEDFVGKYVRLDLSETTSDNWGFNLAFSKLNPDFDSGQSEGDGNWQYLNVDGGWSDLNNPSVKIGNSYYWQIPAEAEYMNPQLWKNSNGDTKTIKVAGFYLAEKIGDDFIITPNTSRTASEYTSAFGDIIFNDGSQLTDASALTLPTGSVVKVVKTFNTGAWYPIGFPFEIASISIRQGENTYVGSVYDHDNGAVVVAGNPAGSASATTDNFYLATYDGAADNFKFAGSLPATNTGYIIAIPAGTFNVSGTDDGSISAGEVEVTFTSIANPTLNSEGSISLADGYTLVANPNLINATSLSEASDYYQFNYGTPANFGRVNAASLSTALKPFEAIVAYKGDTSGMLRSTLNVEYTDVVTALPVITNDAVVSTEYYNLQGVHVGANNYLPLQSGIYIVKQIHASGKTIVSKSIIR